MAYEVVKLITEIEKEGEELVKVAQSRAWDIQKSAKDEAEGIISRAKKEAQDYYTNTIEKYEKEARGEIKPVFEESQKAVCNIRNVHGELLEEAVKLVIERIVNSNGNS